MASRKPAPKTAARRTATAGKDPGDAKVSHDGERAVDDYLAQQPADKRALLEKLRALVNETVPDATASIKWGVPFYQRKGKNICALGAFKDHVGINLFAPPEALADPGGKLEGEAKGSRMFKVRSAADIDAASVRRWLKAVVAAAGG